jgi:tellurite methyltransferase
VNIITIQSDIADFRPKEKYDVVLSTMVLHFLSKDNVQKAIIIMRECTNKDGLNVVTVYTNENPSGLRPYLFEKNELHDAYDGWEIFEYQEALGPETENPKDGGPNRRYSGRLIAKKIKD